MIKKILCLVATFSLSVLATTLFANEKNEPVPPTAPSAKHGDTPPAPHTKRVSKEELQMLKALFAMSNEELARIRGMIARLEQIPEAKRKKMAEDLERATSENPEERQKFMQEMRSRFEKRRQNLLNRYYATLPEEQARREAKEFLKMPKHEQMKYMENVRKKLGLPPRPQHRKRHEAGEKASEKAD